MLGIFADMGWTLTQVYDEFSYLPAVVRNFYATGPQPGFWEGAFESLYVSPDQTMVVDFTSIFDFTNCGVFPITHPNDFPIVNDQFAEGGDFAVTGTFTSQTAVNGTVELDNYFVAACNGSFTGGPFNWSAVWVNGSQPTLVVQGGTFEVSPAESGAREVRRTQ